MAVLPSTGGLVVIFDTDAASSLRRVAKAHHMLILATEAADQAFQAILCHRPCVIILQVGRVMDEALKLIRLVTTAAQPVPVIVAATRHSARMERSLLQAGATYYLPSPRQDHVDRLLGAVLPPEEDG